MTCWIKLRTSLIMWLFRLTKPWHSVSEAVCWCFLTNMLELQLPLLLSTTTINIWRLCLNADLYGTTVVAKGFLCEPILVCMCEFCKDLCVPIEISVCVCVLRTIHMYLELFVHFQIYVYIITFVNVWIHLFGDLCWCKAGLGYGLWIVLAQSRGGSSVVAIGGMCHPKIISSHP